MSRPARLPLRFGAMLAGLLYLLPVLSLALSLALRRYPGERVVLALAARGRRRRRRPARGTANRPALAPRALVPRGGLLIGASLAVRPPPRLAGACS
jgi:hypothetical protein